MAPTHVIALPIALVSIFTVFLSALLGALTPVLLVGTFSFQADPRFFRYGNAFAAGILLSAGLVHLLPDADQSFRVTFPHVSYPFAGLLALCGAVAVFCLDSVVRTNSSKSPSNPSHRSSPPPLPPAHTSPFPKPSAVVKSSEADPLLRPQPGRYNAYESPTHYEEPNAPPTRQTLTSTILAYILTATLSFHSLVEGLSLGASVVRQSQFVAIIAAILAHKIFAAFSLGMSLAAMSAEIGTMDAKLRAMYAAVGFACVTPIGASLGLWAVQSWFSHQNAFVISAVLNCLSAGIFIYIALVELLGEDSQAGCAPSKVQIDQYLSQDGLGLGNVEIGFDGQVTPLHHLDDHCSSSSYEQSPKLSPNDSVYRAGIFVVAAAAMSVLAIWT